MVLWCWGEGWGARWGEEGAREWIAGDGGRERGGDAGGEGLVQVKAKCLDGQFVLSRDLAPKIVSISSPIR